MTTNDELRQEYERGYNDGFDRGAEAVIQQIDGILENDWCGSGEKVKDLIRLVREFWKEHES